jgi:hypothetical protein
MTPARISSNSNPPNQMQTFLEFLAGLGLAILFYLFTLAAFCL